ncbi:SDR family NAD(P)-dependent oxidoreductase [Chloroflexota bacterium]
MATKSITPLKDKVALITGAGSGIGQATARNMAEAGAKVVLADIDSEGGKRTEADLQMAKHDAIFIQVDVTSEEQVQKMIDTTLECYGRLDVLHNNAGIISVYPSIERTSLREWQRVIDVDLTSVFLGCKYGVPALKKTGGGVIINTSSFAGLNGFSHGLDYAAAKGGVVILTRSLAALLEPDNIRVNCICPRAVDTPLGRGEVNKSSAKEGKDIKAQYSTSIAKVMLKPGDIARLVLFLATKASFTGGAVAVEPMPDGSPKYSLAFEYKRKDLRIN